MFAHEERPIRILIVDDHAMFRTGLRLAVESQPTMCVVGEAADRATALAVAAAEQPDIILLDLDLGDEDGEDLIPELLDVAVESRIILLTGIRDPEAHRRAVLLGAMGLVLKEKAMETVLKAIEKVYAGEVWLDRAMIASILNTRIQKSPPQQHNADVDKIATLTDREREMIRLIGNGMRNPQIAMHMQISEATVRHHLTAIYTKLGLQDRFDLVIFAYRHGLASVPS